jgi:hypothetical protein
VDQPREGQPTTNPLDVSCRHRHLPGIVQFAADQRPDNEFASLLQLRFLEWREIVLRPILYIVLHHDQHQTLPPGTMQLATKALDVCASVLVSAVSRFRHGGTWLVARRPFSCACLLLAVVLRPECGLQPPQDWRALVELATKSLRFWGQEARDLRRMGDVLEAMYTETCLRAGLDPSTSREGGYDVGM